MHINTQVNTIATEHTENIKAMKTQNAIQLNTNIIFYLIYSYRD